MPSKSREADEFVLTISDNDDLDLSDASEEPAHPVSNKRKRIEDAPKRKSKKAKKITENVESDSDSDEEGQKERDEGFDSDFEFDTGVADASGNVEDFDGWGAADSTLKQQSKPLKRGIDVDDIIARRAEKTSAKNKAQSKLEDDVSSAAESDEEEEVESEDGEEAEIDFDDENLAEDAFGAGAEDQEGVEEEGSEDNSDAEDDQDSDDESVASPVAHPDDMDSDNGASDNESQTSHSDVEEAAKRKAFFASEDDHKPAASSAESFQQFSLSRPLLRALTALGFTVPTPIQTRTIPVALQGIDVVGSAQTGSGKTAAFLLPILERLLYRPRKIPTTRVAILMPTRELAVQCFNVATALSRFTDITFAQVVGGFSLREQETILKKRPDVVIATPGRFIDHMRNSPSFTVDTLEILVLDEADRMLEQGFTDELDEILRTIPRSRQTMLFSATMTSSVDKLVRLGMNKPVRLSVDTTLSTVSGLTQEFLRLRPGKDTPEYRLATLCTLLTTTPEYTTRTIIFFRQKKEAHRIRIVLGLLGLKAAELHGSMTQDQRIDSVNSFRDGKKTLLLATDVASRGLDIKNVQCVINFEAPQTHEIYLHRVGRTARAGKSGKSCTLAAEPDRKIVKAAVKSARSQGAKVTSRVLDATAIAEMHDRLDGMADEIEDILKEEKQEKTLAQMEAEVSRGQNMVKHHEEIMSRPKRTWFESEREKQANRDRAKVEEAGVLLKTGKKKLSNKDKKKLELTRERKEGRQWKKGRDEAVSVGRSKKGGAKGGKGGAAKGKPRGKKR